MVEANGTIPTFLPRVVDFPNGISYELSQPLTNFRQCHDGTPAEARIVFLCRQLGTDAQKLGENEFVMKVKVQVRGNDQKPSLVPEGGPSTTTAAELKVLKTFREANSPYAPHLVDFKTATQGPDGLLPGGYFTFTVMTKLLGGSLHDLGYWKLPIEEREEIGKKFLVALRSIYALGIEPEDRALRNVLWERDTRTCSLVDFELWRETTDPVGDDTKMLRRWALARRPPAKNWWEAWNTMEEGGA